MKRLLRIVDKLLRLFSLIFGLLFKSLVVRKKVKRKNEINKELITLQNPKLLVDRAKSNRLKQEKKEIDQYLIKVARIYQRKVLKLNANIGVPRMQKGVQ